MKPVGQWYERQSTNILRRPGDDVGSEQMRFRLLGPLVVTRGAEVVDIGPAKQRAMLAVLLCRANSVVSTTDLIEVLWPGGAPRTALKNLQVYACALRKILATGGCSLDYRSPGYRVSVEDSALDSAEFHALTRRGRRCLRSGDSVGAADLLRLAVNLWQGPALAEFLASPILRHEADRLTVARLEAYEHLVEAHLNTGSAGDVLDELAELVRSHPIRERLRGLQMAALYQVGRQGEALAVYDDVRQELARELGLSPSPALCRQYQEMIAGEPPARQATSGPVTPSRLWLPRALGDFVGRGQELSALLRVLNGPGDSIAPTVAVVHGLPGVGKTTLAVHVGHVLRSTYPDGQIFVRLRDGTKRRTLTDVFADLLGKLVGRRRADAVHEDDGAAFLRAVLADRRVLLILDDATDQHELQLLLPSTASSAALVTSRRLFTLDSACYLRLAPFTVTEAVELLGRVVGSSRINAVEAAEGLVRSAHLLPAVVRAAATTLLARPDASLRSRSVRTQVDAALRNVVTDLVDDLDAEERRVLVDVARGSDVDDADIGVAEQLLRAHAVVDAGDGCPQRYRTAEPIASYVCDLLARGGNEPRSYRSRTRRS